MKLHHDKEWLRRMYWDEGLSTHKMGRLAGVDSKTVQAQMVKFGIPRRNDKLGGFDTYKDREWLHQKYVIEQMSTLQIGEMVGRSNTTVCNWLREFGIPIRDQNELRLVEMSEEQIAEAARLYREGWSLLKLMDKYGVSQGVLQRRLDRLVKYRPCNRRYSINEHMFDDLDREEAAYFAGFLFADGFCKNTFLSVILSSKDREILVKLKDFLESGNPVSEFEDKGSYKIRFQCSGIHLSNRLKELGVSNNVDGLEILRKELSEDSFRHWLRGFHDGDGSAQKAGSLAFCGKREVLEFVRERTDVILSESGARKIHKHKSGSIYYLLYSKGYPARLVSEYMYAGATIYLSRKWKTVTEVWPITSPGSVPDCAKQKRAA